MTEKATKISTLCITAITSFSSPFMISAVNIALPAIQAEFSVHAVILSWVATSYILATAVALVPVGKIADIYGRKKVYIIGIVLFTIASLLCAFAKSIQLLIFLRILQGIGGAMIVTTGMAIIVSVFSLHERGMAIGVNVAAVYVGLSAGPFIGGLVTQHITWRAIFLISVPFGLMAIILILLFLKQEWADARGEKLDIFGSVLYGISLIALMYGASILPKKTAIWMIVLGCLGLYAFVRHELNTPNPVFEMRLFKNNRVFSFSCVAALINYASTFAVTFLLSLYFQYIMGLPPQTAGVVLVSQPIMQAVFSPFAGKLSDRVEPAIIASTGMGLTAMGLFMLVFISPETSFVFIVGVLVLLGIGFALFSSPNMNAIMSSVEKKYYGIASGSVATMRTVGMTISMAIATIAFAIFIGQEEISPATYPALEKSIKFVLIFFTFFCSIGIYFSSARGKLKR
jgi:EmrB/QacA subfamily drug resistance transporter